jgi:hypothetical protein
VRNDTCARQSEDDVFRCLAWLYDGISLPAAVKSQTTTCER